MGSDLRIAFLTTGDPLYQLDSVLQDSYIVAIGITEEAVVDLRRDARVGRRQRDAAQGTRCDADSQQLKIPTCCVDQRRVVADHVQVERLAAVATTRFSQGLLVR